MTARPPTIADVAAAAGVSRATVSRVVNGLATVDPAIAERVRDAVDRLRYRPSPTARSLSLGRTQTVAVMVPDLANPMFQAVLRGVTRAAERDGYRVLVSDSHEVAGSEADWARDARRRCDALILCAPRMDDAELRDVLAESAPVALVNRVLPGVAVPQVAVDYAQVTGLLVDHLASLGHRRIAWLGGPAASAANALRLDGLAAASSRHPGLEVERMPTGSTLDDGWAAADAVLASPASAVVAFNDLVALGLLARLRELGVDVPRRLSVVGVDDIPFARFSDPGLTTVAVPESRLGVEAWQRLHATLAGVAPDEPLWLAGELRVRGSSAVDAR